jgi:ADP-heptose:LPS heptosyltransferase
LAQRVHSETGWNGVICGGPDDTADAGAIADACGKFVTNLAGQTTLGQLARVLAGAVALVSNETSAIHMAAALRVRSVCITGGGHFGRFVPYNLLHPEANAEPRIAAQPMACYGCNWLCRYHPPRGNPVPCIEEVSVDTVWQELAACLGLNAGSAGSALVQLNNPTKEELSDSLVGMGSATWYR